MLSTMRQSWLLFTLLALIAFSSAMSLEEALNIDGIEEYLHHGAKRQASGTGSAQDATSDVEPTNTPEPSSAPPASTPQNTPTPTPTPDEPSDSPAPSSNPPASTGGGGNNNRPSSTPAPNSTPAPSAEPSSERITTPVVRTTPLVATSVQEYLTVVTTVSDGQTLEVTQTTSSVALRTTGTAEVTTLPEVAEGSGDSGGGLTPQNKKIIGGVVGGVGGAILLGGIAIVLWRLRSKKRVTEDDDDLMAGTGSALGDKPQGSPNSTPFQSNLEQYHNPGGRPNAAANF